MNTLRPHFKPIVYRRKTEEGAVRLAELFPDRAVELEDEDGAIQTALELMDGTRTLDELLHALAVHYPSVTLADLELLVQELDALSFVDDASKRRETSLTQEELERAKANLNYFSYFSTLDQDPWTMQRKLRDARVTVIGVGTLGSGVLANLAGFGAANVRIVDFDTVELSNLNRQLLFRKQDIGSSKIESAQTYIRHFYPEMNLEGMSAEIRSTADALAAVEGSDLVVLAADRPYFQLERWVNEACVRSRIPLVGGGVNGAEGQFYTMIPGETGCIDCNHLQQSRINPDYATFVRQYVASGFSMPSAALMSSYWQLTGMLCGDIARLLTGYAPVASRGRVIVTNFVTFASTASLHFETPSPDCPTCGSGDRGDDIFQALAGGR